MDLTGRLQQFLEEHQVLTLAVIADGGPHAAAVFYATGPEWRLYFVTDPATRHGRALRANPAVAGTIQRDRQDWRELRGLQLRGRCRRLSGPARDLAWQVYTGRYSFLSQPGGGLASRLAQALGRVELWELELEWLRLSDNRQGFGHKTEWTRPAAGQTPAVS